MSAAMNGKKLEKDFEKDFAKGQKKVFYGILKDALKEQHRKAGFVLGLFGVFVLLFGAVSLYRHELGFWVGEETHALALAPGKANREKAAEAGLAWLVEHAPREGEWHVRLPSERDPVPHVAVVAPEDVHDHHHWRFMPFDVEKGEPVRARETVGGDFLYRLHVDLFGMGRTGRVVVALGTLFMLGLVVSGIVLRRGFFRHLFNRPKGRTALFEWHCVLGSSLVPFAVIIMLSGLVLSAQSFLPRTLFPHYQDNRRAFVVESKGIRKHADPLEARAMYPGEQGRLHAQLHHLMDVTERRWEGVGAGSLTFRFEDGEIHDMVATQARGTLLTRRAGPERLVCHVENGRIVSEARGQEPGVVASLWYAFQALHLGRFASPATRLVLFASALMLAGMTAAGLLWRERRLGEGYAATLSGHLASSFTTLAVTGLPLAMGAHLCAARLLPAELGARVGLEMAAFFVPFFGSLVHALARGGRGFAGQRLARFEQALAGAVFFGILSLVAFFGTNPGPMSSLSEGIPVIFGTAMAFLCAFVGLAFHARNMWAQVRVEALAGYKSLPLRVLSVFSRRAGHKRMNEAAGNMADSGPVRNRPGLGEEQGNAMPLALKRKMTMEMAMKASEDASARDREAGEEAGEEGRDANSNANRDAKLGSLGPANALNGLKTRLWQVLGKAGKARKGSPASHCDSLADNQDRANSAGMKPEEAMSLAGEDRTGEDRERTAPVEPSPRARKDTEKDKDGLAGIDFGTASGIDASQNLEAGDGPMRKEDGPDPVLELVGGPVPADKERSWPPTERNGKGKRAREER